MERKSKTSLDGSLMLFVSVFLMGLVITVAGAVNTSSTVPPTPDEVLGATIDSHIVESLTQCSDILASEQFDASLLKNDAGYRRLDLSVTSIGNYTEGSCLYIEDESGLLPVLVIKEGHRIELLSEEFDYNYTGLETDN